jgi:putative transposase
MSHHPTLRRCPGELIQVEVGSGPLGEDQTIQRKRSGEEQIIGLLKEHEAGVKRADLCRKHGISDATFYNWKNKYGGLDVSEAKRLRSLEGENARLKRLLTDGMLGNAALKDLLTKNGDARGEARGRVSSAEESPDERAADVPDNRLRAHDDPVPLPATG